jgi:hypothetical protein
MRTTLRLHLWLDWLILCAYARRTWLRYWYSWRKR